MSQDKNKPTLADWMIKSLDIPADVLCNGLRVELRGRHTVTVHGCGKIEEYTSERIRLSVSGGILSVCGRGLECDSYLAGAVGINGRIDSIAFEEEKAI